MSKGLERFFNERELDLIEKEEKQSNDSIYVSSFSEDVSYFQQKYGNCENAY